MRGYELMHTETSVILCMIGCSVSGDILYNIIYIESNLLSLYYYYILLSLLCFAFNLQNVIIDD